MHICTYVTVVLCEMSDSATRARATTLDHEDTLIFGSVIVVVSLAIWTYATVMVVKENNEEGEDTAISFICIMTALCA